MGKSKLLFITHEMSPFLELTKIAEITRQLPQAMQEKGFEIRILMPRFADHQGGFYTGSAHAGLLFR
jgi:starch synthase